MSRVYSTSQLCPGLPPLMPVPTYVAPVITSEHFDGITDPQRYALLTARAGEIAAKLRAHMDEMGWPMPIGEDWSALRERGYIARDPSSPRCHMLLPRGLTVAHAIMSDLARKFGVHHVTYQPGSTMSGHKATCTCGFIAVEDANRAGYFAVRRHGGAHMQQAIAGTLPQSYRIGGGQ